jgi:hypothetical protein
MEELKNIIKEIQSYKKLFGMNISDDMILDCSTRIFNSGNIKNDSIKKESKEEKATEKQIGLLRKLKYPGDTSKLTKREASKLIDEGIGK